MNEENITVNDEPVDRTESDYSTENQGIDDSVLNHEGNMSFAAQAVEFLILLGFKTGYYLKKSFITFIKLLIYPLRLIFNALRFMIFYFGEFVKKANKSIINESQYFLNDLKVARLLLKQNKSVSNHQKEKGATLLLRFYKTAVHKHRQFLKRTISYVVPLISVTVLIFVFNSFSDLNFALDVTYNNVHIGYIENENIFRHAKDMLEQRLQIGSEESIQSKVSQPEYKIVIVDLSELSDANDVCEQLIANSDSGLTTACGIYVDNKFIGSVKNESDASSVFKSYISAYCLSNGIDNNNPQVVLDLVEKVSYIQGLYSESTLMDSDDLREYLLTHNKSEINKYTVPKNSTVVSICEQNKITTEQFLSTNPSLKIDSKIKKGESVNIIRSIPFINVTVSKTETQKKAIKFKTVEIKTNSLYQGVTKVVTPGSDGEKQVTTLVTYIDEKKVSSKEISSKVLKEAVDRKIYVGTKPVPNNVTILGTQSGTFIWPTIGANTVTSGFGYRYIFGSTSFHRGVDIAGPGASGKAVVASADGVVEKVTRSNTGYGYCVLLDHGNGIKTRYAHCQAGSICVNAGQRVVQGQMIAKIGSTGNSTGPHLHFEILYNGSYANPLNYLTR